jgi:hypothetical protein
MDDGSELGAISCSNCSLPKRPLMQVFLPDQVIKQQLKTC